MNVCNWLLLMEQGQAVGLFCSDVFGAFDRVDKDRLRAKLFTTGLHPKVVTLLSSWLADRMASVVVGGQASPLEPLTDSVFQGTVLGPQLWNLFYEDARHAVNCKEYKEHVFADDFLIAGSPLSSDTLRSPPTKLRLCATCRKYSESYTVWFSEPRAPRPVKRILPPAP